MQALTGYAMAHWAGLLVLAGAVATPAIATMPAAMPRSLDAWWTWLYDYAHQLANSRNTRLATEPIPTPPEPSLPK